MIRSAAGCTPWRPQWKLRYTQCGFVLNSYRPINSVPSDILVHILSFVARGRDIVPVARVCRHWMAVVLGTPSLWAFFNDYHQRWRIDLGIIPFLLDRAKNAPFDVRIRQEDSGYGFSRANIQEFFREFLANCDREAPQLEYLLLDSPLEFTREIDTALFRGTMPAFRRLTLHGMRPIPTMLSSNLRCLYLGCMTLSARDFLGYLEAAPRLDTLMLRSLTLIPDMRCDLSPIRLDYLRRLLIQVPGSASTRFFILSTTVPRRPSNHVLPPAPDLTISYFFRDLKTLEYSNAPPITPIHNAVSARFLHLNGQDSSGSSFTFPALDSPSDLFLQIPGHFYIAQFVLSVRNVTHLLLFGADDEALWRSDEQWERGTYT
ncbi:hypothetical protein EVG20_g5202 [Dentipellis fragilis]|uniref:F-box domain-containing protein n=1 Tax=Dentipellis fragilis TaxID=205917 RepID=A0A4Y9YVX4_9AGAM|nr:hypothetical protein EVG20_g5202 [Dentipellis fragilis]